jgi:hypothetical protein
MEGATNWKYLESVLGKLIERLAHPPRGRLLTPSPTTARAHDGATTTMSKVKVHI